MAKAQIQHITPNGHRLGWKPDLPDARDHLFRKVTAPVPNPPNKISLRKQFPYVFDQGQLGSCTANAACLIFGALKGVKTLDAAYSRLFYYYQERSIEKNNQSRRGRTNSRRHQSTQQGWRLHRKGMAVRRCEFRKGPE